LLAHQTPLSRRGFSPKSVSGISRPLHLVELVLGLEISKLGIGEHGFHYFHEKIPCPEKRGKMGSIPSETGPLGQLDTMPTLRQRAWY
ncbi:hypothetical protein KUT57_20665, partial [Pseudomonas aeruginosa]|nr:hypothetical protein [Pseudomonas aeruginosa]